MSINPLNDISRVYLEQVALSEAKVDKKLPEYERSGARLKRYDNPSGALALGGGQQRARRAEHEARRGKSKRWWDDDGDGVGYETGEVSGKFERKRKEEKKLKESFSNWRGDLFEILDTMDDEESQSQIKEKKVNNKKLIKINPTIQETVEEFGGTLLEMIEVDELDFIVESVYNELIGEGYYESDIEEALEYALVEARVTYGHDTPSMEKKRESLLSIVKRKLSGAKKALKGSIKRGAEYVARKMSDEDETKPSAVHSKPGVKAAQPYRGSGAGRVERAGSPKPKRIEKPSDPWEGSATVPTTKKKKASTPKTKTTKVSRGESKSPARKRKTNSDKLDDLLADIRKEEIQINEMPYQVMGSPDGKKEKRIGKPVKSKKYADARAAELEDTHKKTGGKYRSQYVENTEYIDERTLTSAETQEKERIVKSMKDKAAGFEKRYPGRGKEVMYATVTKMAKKIAEQQLVNHLYKPEGETIEERTNYAKKTGMSATRKNRKSVKGGAKDDPAFTMVKRYIRNLEGTPPGQRKKVPGEKPPAAGERGGPVSPAAKIAKRRAEAQRAQDAMHSRFD